MSKIEAIRDLRMYVPSLCLSDAKRFIETATDDYLREMAQDADRAAGLRVESLRSQLADAQRVIADLRSVADARQRECDHADERIRALEEAITEHVLGRRLLPALQHTAFPDDALPF